MDGSGSKCHIKILFFFCPYNVILLCLVNLGAEALAYLCFQFQHVALSISLTWGNTSYTCVGKKAKPSQANSVLLIWAIKLLSLWSQEAWRLDYWSLFSAESKIHKYIQGCKEQKRQTKTHHVTKFLQGQEKRLRKEQKQAPECSICSLVTTVHEFLLTALSANVALYVQGEYILTWLHLTTADRPDHQCWM